MAEKQYECPECNSEFSSEETLELHMERVHPQALGEGNSPKTPDQRVNEQSDQSFPASDPPSYTPVQGSGTPAEPLSDDE